MSVNTRERECIAIFGHEMDMESTPLVCCRNGQLLDPGTVVINKRGNRHSLLIQKIGE